MHHHIRHENFNLSIWQSRGRKYSNHSTDQSNWAEQLVPFSWKSLRSMRACSLVTYKRLSLWFSYILVFIPSSCVSGLLLSCLPECHRLIGDDRLLHLQSSSYLNELSKRWKHIQNKNLKPIHLNIPTGPFNKLLTLILNSWVKWIKKRERESKKGPSDNCKQFCRLSFHWALQANVVLNF